MRHSDRKQPTSEQSEYYRVRSIAEAYVIAKVLKYDMESVQLVSEAQLQAIPASKIQEIEAGWLVAASPLIQSPIKTIAIGVIVGYVVVAVVMAIFGMMMTS